MSCVVVRSRVVVVALVGALCVASGVRAQAPVPNPLLRTDYREQLYQRIEHRFMQMMDRGLLDEVRKLFDRGDLNSQLPSMRSVGYRQLWEHLAGGCSLHEGVRQAILATRHLARRQLIWLRAIEGLHWLDALEPTAADEIYKCIATASRRLVNH